MTDSNAGRGWRFFRAGGFDQVRLDSGADLCAIDALDQKLWVALACPVKGLEFDPKTLELIDTDKDGRVRAPEVIAAVKWACAMLRDPEVLIAGAGGPGLALGAINDASEEGKQILASAKQILANLGRGEATITVDDTADTKRIFAQTRFNGDGIVPVDASEDPAVTAAIADILGIVGPETDRSGKPGLSAAKAEQFFKDARVYAEWYASAEGAGGEGGAGGTILVLGEATPRAAATLIAVRAKVNDYFARCRLAAYDRRAEQALNRQEEDYLAIAARDLTITSTEIASLPLARVEAGRALPMNGELNPAWSASVAALDEQVIRPLLGEREALSEAEWGALQAKLAAYEAWAALKPVTPVEKLGMHRVREILSAETGIEAAINGLLAKDKALEPEANGIAAVERLVRYHRDLYKLLNNFVSFRDFYARKEKAVFQAGTLYLDQRSCELCVRVDDMARHGLMAHLSQMYLAYCECVRKSTNEKMTIAAAFTAGDSDNLMVGRNGIFYDRLGRDWDATIVKIIDNPISIRQAFWSPYKRTIKWVEDQLAKRAAAADAAAQASMQAAVTTSFEAPPEGTAPTPPPAAAAAPPAPKKVDVGVVAALGVAVGAITTALGIFLNWLSGTPKFFIPLYVALVMLAISLPSMLIAWLKLRQRNLAPLLDANGWAVNARAKINFKFGRVLTRTRALPPGAKRDLTDPYADSHVGRDLIIAGILVAATVWGLWYFGALERVAPGVFPKSAWVTAHAAPADVTPPATQPAK